jgi:hypothetical protein
MINPAVIMQDCGSSATLLVSAPDPTGDHATLGITISA